MSRLMFLGGGAHSTQHTQHNLYYPILVTKTRWPLSVEESGSQKKKSQSLQSRQVPQQTSNNGDMICCWNDMVSPPFLFNCKHIVGRNNWAAPVHCWWRVETWGGTIVVPAVRDLTRREWCFFLPAWLLGRAWSQVDRRGTAVPSHVPRPNHNRA